MKVTDWLTHSQISGMCLHHLARTVQNSCQHPSKIGVWKYLGCGLFWHWLIDWHVAISHRKLTWHMTSSADILNAKKKLAPAHGLEDPNLLRPCPSSCPWQAWTSSLVSFLKSVTDHDHNMQDMPTTDTTSTSSQKCFQKIYWIDHFIVHSHQESWNAAVGSGRGGSCSCFWSGLQPIELLPTLAQRWPPF